MANGLTKEQRNMLGWHSASTFLGPGYLYNISGRNKYLGPYTRDTSNIWQKFLGGNWFNNYDQAGELRNEIRARAAELGDSSIINNMTDSELDAFLENYYQKNDNGWYNLGGAAGSSETLDTETLLKHLQEAISFKDAYPNRYFSISSVYNNAKAQIEAEDQKLLDSLNEDLYNIGDAYRQDRDTLLAQQYQRNAQTVDTMASDMQRARRNAIEAGASAGIRIAGNVNAVLSAQNKMSQAALDTSNQLAQMLVNQRNAEAGLRNQWRDAQQTQYDRIQSRYSSEYGRKQDVYDEKVSEWNRKADFAMSESNPLNDRIKAQNERSAY